MNLPISLIGRNATIKMTILPIINSLFSMIPIKPSPTWFKSLDSFISKFYWKNKTPRIKLATLQKPKSQGGLEAPHFYHYFISHQLQYIYKWMHPDQINSSWIYTKQTACKEIHISHFPFTGHSIICHPCIKNPVIATALTAWWKFHQITNTTLSLNKYTPIWNNPDFLVDRKPLNFLSWISKGITHVEDINHNNILVSLPYLDQKYGTGENHFFELMQIKNNPPNLDLPSTSKLLNITSSKKLLSEIYKLIATNDQLISIPSTKWEQDLQSTPSTDFWTQIKSKIENFFKNNLKHQYTTHPIPNFT